ncbi:Crp/Fnr family transcriptional regulator [Anaerovorax sp. IOR16]|uniref:Crp/Fnr family transcriptional regulator n=1 Tax=Anaerovorax sp. IOR16 TaxID=2773458 RepID=UPI0019D03EDE|nr:Crp/Fnr family transcriptional regulator [Anaerovorax sp. IOR16]
MDTINLIYPTSISNLFPKEIMEDWINHGKEITFKKGDTIIKPQGFLNDIYIVKEGNVHIFYMHGDGKECVVGILSKGDFIHMFDIFTEGDSKVFAKALTDVKVSAIKKDEIRKVVKADSKLSMELLSNFSLRYQEIIEVLSQVAYGKVEERLLFLFHKLADKNKEENGWIPVSVAVTHQDIAGMVASTRETVTLLINKFIQKGFVRQHNNKIWIKKE